MKEDLVDEGIIVDNSGFKKYYENVVDRLRNFITTHVKSVVLSDDADCELKMSKVILKTICKTCFSVLENANPQRQHVSSSGTEIRINALFQNSKILKKIKKKTHYP